MCSLQVAAEGRRRFLRRNRSVAMFETVLGSRPQGTQGSTVQHFHALCRRVRVSTAIFFRCLQYCDVQNSVVADQMRTRAKLSAYAMLSDKPMPRLGRVDRKPSTALIVCLRLSCLLQLQKAGNLYVKGPNNLSVRAERPGQQTCFSLFCDAPF